jgi:nitric oxide reductase NorE protein
MERYNIRITSTRLATSTAVPASKKLIPRIHMFFSEDADRSATLPSKRIPGEAGIWVFILGDIVVFGIFFMTYLSYRSQNLSLYRLSQEALDCSLGFTNTFLLLLSSLLVSLGVQMVRADRTIIASRFFVGAMGCGGGFCLVKVFEYGAKVQAGIDLTTNEFYTFYFMLTGIHLLHLLVGMALLLLLALAARKPEPNPRFFEGAGVYWHLVDLLWIMLFPLLYLLR